MQKKAIREQEIKLLAEEQKKNPEKFRREFFIDSPDFLEKIGISFGNNVNFPKGYLKLWPQDFIVEEVPMNGKIQTIDMGDFWNPKKIKQQGPIFNTTLVKCGALTFEPVEEMAEFLGVEKERIKFSGLKDEDAITSQKISIDEVSRVRNLQKLNSPYFFLKDSYFGKEFVNMGYLKGNKFTILIRIRRDFDEERFNEKLQHIQENGFYNFFYSQRFGSPRFINWFWGYLILEGKYKDAVFSYLCTRGHREIDFFADLREQVKNNFGDWKKVREIFGRFSTFFPTEMRIINYLEKDQDDFAGALGQVPEQVQLWVSAYSSLLFNKKLSNLIINNQFIPEKLPLVFSEDKEDFDENDFKNLKPFKNLIPKKREVSTIQKLNIEKLKIIAEGVVMSFVLPKGCYATTFLAHLFSLGIDGIEPGISEKAIDIKETLGEKPIADVVERFKEVIYSKNERAI